MKLRTSEYFVQEVLRSLRRNNWMSFASIGTVAVSLFVLGVFLLLVLNMNRMASTLESQVQISVYLEDGLKEADRKDIATDIEALQGIESITYVDKDEAKTRLEERLGDQKYLLDALGGQNPLPDSFEITVTEPSGDGFSQRVQVYYFTETADGVQQQCFSGLLAGEDIPRVTYGQMLLRLLKAAFLAG